MCESEPYSLLFLMLFSCWSIPLMERFPHYNRTQGKLLVLNTSPAVFLFIFAESEHVHGKLWLAQLTTSFSQVFKWESQGQTERTHKSSAFNKCSIGNENGVYIYAQTAYIGTYIHTNEPSVEVRTCVLCTSAVLCYKPANLSYHQG